MSLVQGARKNSCLNLGRKEQPKVTSVFIFQAK